jgi:hypothetical protein
MRILIPFLALLILPAAAEAACSDEHQSCRAQCEQGYPGEALSMGRAGCVARCGTELGLCEGRELYSDSERAYRQELRPWIEQQADRWRQFRDGFAGREPPAPSLGPQSPPAQNGRLPGATDL